MVRVRQPRDQGLTVVELLVSASLFLVAFGMFSGSLYASQRLQRQSSEFSRANDQIQVALQSIDRQIRSGFVVGTASLAGADAAVIIYSQATGAPRCFAWAFADEDAGGKSGEASLFTASWAASASRPAFSLAGANGWVKMASGLWNWKVSPQVEPFTAQVQAVGLLKTLDVSFLVNTTLEGRARATAAVKSTYTSRNLERSDITAGTSCV